MIGQLDHVNGSFGDRSEVTNMLIKVCALIFHASC